MRVENITPEMISDFLDDFYGNENIPSNTDLLALHLLASYKTDAYESPLLYLYDFLKKHIIEELNNQRQISGVPTITDNYEIGAGLGTVLDVFKQDFSSKNRRLKAWSAVYHRFFVFQISTATAIFETTGVSRRQFYRYLQKGLSILVSILAEQEEFAHQANRKVHLIDRLPPATYGHLVGRSEVLTKLFQVYHEPYGPNMYSIEGSGGSGKTSIAHKLAYELLRQEELQDFIWIAMRSRQFTSQGELKFNVDAVNSIDEVVDTIGKAFNFKPTGDNVAMKVRSLCEVLPIASRLVVVDGVDALQDPLALLSVLEPLTTRMKFVFTSRYTLKAHAGISVTRILGLSPEYSKILLQTELAGDQMHLNFDDLAEHVYQNSAGLPLVLTVLAHELNKTGFQELFEAFKTVGKPVFARLFSYLYLPYLQMLESLPQSRQLLLTMLFIDPDGDERDWIEELSALSPSGFTEADTLLCDHNLIWKEYGYTPLRSLPPLFRHYLWHFIRSTMPLSDTVTTDETIAQSAWQKHYLKHLEDRLSWLIERFQDNLLVEEVEMHLERIFILLAQAKYHNQFDLLAAQLIWTLHPLPIQQGYWHNWEQEIIYAAKIFGAHNMYMQQAKLLSERAEIEFYTGHWAEAFTLCQQVIQLIRQEQGLGRVLVKTSYVMINILLNQGKKQEARAYLEEIEQLSINSDDSDYYAIQVELRLLQANLLRNETDINAAIAQCDQAETLLKQVVPHDSRLEAYVRQHQGLMAWSKGEYERAKINLHQAEELFEAINDPSALSFVYGTLGLVYWSAADFSKANEYTTRSVGRAKMLGATWQYACRIGNLGLIVLTQGYPEKAKIHLNDQIDNAKQLGIRREFGRGLANRGIANLHLQQFPDAYRDLSQGYEILHAQQAMISVGCIQVNLSRYYLFQNNLHQAREFAESTLQLAEEAKSNALKIIALRALADLQKGADRVATLELALELSEQRPLDKAACLIALADLTIDDKIRQRLFIEGRDLLIKISADAWLEQQHSDQRLMLPLLV